MQALHSVKETETVEHLRNGTVTYRIARRRVPSCLDGLQCRSLSGSSGTFGRYDSALPLMQEASVATRRLRLHGSLFATTMHDASANVWRTSMPAISDIAAASLPGSS
ncbi:hypothetical protein PHSY_004618 [Pseudozyma hubeiensis SY62]|uniref:Uncharacterized protein n=1 Tax=Pseudozyma hubeiensis (strain SY62) TaxID=1305764 RepID=R9P6R7_PSEHS|nr:hypothetical protein PHSY_004618 [Pseudozyma hubeiensis SY62]GAC97034.1 hypothetical protein PHSY_004618 [Pseudozyma hubeiensis SY62]